MATGKKNKAAAQTGGTLFSRIYKDGADATKRQNKSLVERSMQRKLQSMRDDAEATIDDTQQAIHDEYAKLNKCDFNQVLEYKEEISANQLAITYIDEIAEELFGASLEEVGAEEGE